MTAPEALVVTCALIRRGERMLLARRADSGLWELPGGKVRPGERLADCLAREIEEELNAGVEVGPALGEVELIENGRRLILHCFACRIKKGEPRALEHREIKWILPAEISFFKLCPADRTLLHRLRLT